MASEPWNGYDMFTSEKDIDLFGLHAETDEEAQRDAEFWRKANRNTVIGVVIFLFMVIACGAGVAEWVN